MRVHGWNRRLGRILALVLLAAFPAVAGGKRKAKPRKEPVPSSRILHPEALAPFFEALHEVDATHGTVRVMQFGDSHTAADYWSGRLRRRLQDTFGDAGPGLLMPARPWRGYPHEGARLLTGQTWPAQSLRGKDCDGWVGLAGASAVPIEGEPLKVRAACAAWQVQLFGEGEGAPSARRVPVPAEGEAPAPGPDLPLTLLRDTPFSPGHLRIYGGGESEHSTQDLEIALPLGQRLLGLDLRSGKPGVLYDELGLNGAELLDLDRWNAELRGALLDWTKPNLLVLAYGTNDLGHPPAELEGYAAKVRTLLAALKQETGAAILVVGPLDRMGRRRSARAGLYAGAARVIAGLKSAAQASGCAFWDARLAMGGQGSIQKWRRQSLAQKDLVHLTGPGYQKLGDLLADELLKRYAEARGAKR